MTTYRIKRYFSVVCHSQNSVELRWGVWNPLSFMLHDDSESGHLYDLIKGLDGSNSAGDLARQHNVSRAEVEALIDHLISLDVIEDGSDNALDYYVDTCLPTLIRQDKKENRTIVLTGEPRLVAGLKAMLDTNDTPFDINVADPDGAAVKALRCTDRSYENHGAQFFETAKLFEPWKGKLVVLAGYNADPLMAQALNKLAYAIGFSVLYGCFDGPFLIVGPTVTPNRSACFACFETRVTMNMRSNAGYLNYKNVLGQNNVQFGNLPLFKPHETLLLSHLGLEAVNFALTGNNFTANKALTIHMPTMEFCFHEILKLPGCFTCGAVAERDDEELYINLADLLPEKESA